MTTNDDIMSCLNAMRKQAKKDNAEMKKEVKTRMNELSDKVDNVVKDGDEKERRVDCKMSGIFQRLESIEKRLELTKDKCEEREKTAAEIRNRTNTFKEAMGLETDKDSCKNVEQTCQRIPVRRKEKI